MSSPSKHAQRAADRLGRGGSLFRTTDISLAVKIKNDVAEIIDQQAVRPAVEELVAALRKVRDIDNLGWRHPKTHGLLPDMMREVEALLERYQ